MKNTQPQFPAEEVTLPSKGLLYPENSSIRSGKIEMKYMTAREEDILTNQNYIKNGVAIDKLLKSLIISPIIFDDLLLGDKNAIMIAARILGYGAEYEIRKIHPQTGMESDGIIDLSKIKDKELNKDLITEGKNEFDFLLPTSKTDITFKLLTHSDESKIDTEIEGMKKLNKNTSGTIRLKHTILSVNGDYEKSTIRNFVDNQFLAKEAREFRKHVAQIQPSVDLSFDYEDNEGNITKVDIPVGLDFFWPDATI